MTRSAANDHIDGCGVSHPDASLLTGFIEQSLPKEMHARIMHHLGQCQNCRKVVVLATPDVVPASAPIVRIIPSRRPYYALRWALATATMAIVAATGLLLRSPKLPDIASTQLHPKAAEVSTETPARSKSNTLPGTDPTLATSQLRTTQKPRDDSPDRSGMVNTGTETHKMSRLPKDGSVAVPFVTQTGNPDPLISSPVPWMLGQDGALYRSGERGRQWERVIIGERETFRSISSVGQTVWVLTKDGKLMRSSDSGNHWSDLSAPLGGLSASALFVRVHFTDALHGVISNSEGRRWFTSDGGETWH